MNHYHLMYNCTGGAAKDPHGVLSTCPVLYIVAGLGHKLLVKFMYIDGGVKCCCPVGHACVEVRVRDGNGLNAPQLLNLPFRISGERVDTIPKDVAASCTAHESRWGTAWPCIAGSPVDAFLPDD